MRKIYQALISKERDKCLNIVRLFLTKIEMSERFNLSWIDISEIFLFSRDLFRGLLKGSYFPGNRDNRADRSENVAQLKLFDRNL